MNYGRMFGERDAFNRTHKNRALGLVYKPKNKDKYPGAVIRRLNAERGITKSTKI